MFSKNATYDHFLGICVLFVVAFLLLLHVNSTHQLVIGSLQANYVKPPGDSLVLSALVLGAFAAIAYKTFYLVFPAATTFKNEVANKRPRLIKTVILACFSIVLFVLLAGALALPTNSQSAFFGSTEQSAATFAKTTFLPAIVLTLSAFILIIIDYLRDKEQVLPKDFSPSKHLVRSGFLLTLLGVYLLFHGKLMAFLVPANTNVASGWNILTWSLAILFLAVQFVLFHKHLVAYLQKKEEDSESLVNLLKICAAMGVPLLGALGTLL
jgi:preprotein translocase subunit SecG